MRTAEMIVNEYLHLGYSLESLRVLAESRPEPVCSQMLSIIDELRSKRASEAGLDKVEDVECDTDGIVIFDADEPLEGGQLIDFDVMAATVEPPADGEESVADVEIHHSAGENDVAKPNARVWSRRWRDEAAETAGAALDSIAELFAGVETKGAPVGDEAETVLERVSDKLETADQADARVEAPPPSPGSLGLGERTAVDELLSGIPFEASASISGSVVSLQAETSDYLPGSVVFQPEDSASTPLADAESAAPRSDGDAPASDAEHGVSESGKNGETAMDARAEDESDAASAAMAGEGADALSAEAPNGETPAMPEQGEGEAIDAAAGSDDDAPVSRAEQEEDGADARPESGRHPVLFSPGLADAPRAGKVNRKERRRRERAEKKKQKANGKKTGQARVREPELPEIIMARSDGTDTLVPEAELLGLAMTDAVSAALPMPEEAVCPEEEPRALQLSAGESGPASDEEDRVDGQAAAPDANDSGEEGDGTAEDPGVTSSESALALCGENETAAVGPDKDENVMLIANGGLDLRSDAYALLADSSCSDENDDYAPGESGEPDGNVILFRPSLAAFGDDDEEEYGAMLELSGPESESENWAAAGPYLRMLPPVEDGGSENGSEEPVVAPPAESEAEAAVPPIARIGLLRALLGPAVHEDEAGETDIVAGDAEKEHVIVAVQPDAAEAEAETARRELEAEYQRSLDEFASRMLEMQGLLARKDSSVKEKQAELEVRERELDNLRQCLTREEARSVATNELLAEARAENGRRLAELDTYRGLHGEHERLFREFEDLRRAYNEVVADVMPSLQEERDDLVLTVERQCEEAERLRSTLRSSSRRLAAGYALGAAASLMLIALPIANWLKSGEEVRLTAEQYQQVSEFRERAEKAEQRNVDAEKRIFDLEQTAKVAQMERDKAKNDYAQMSKLADQRTRELAAAKADNGSGNAALALSGATRDEGPLRRNEVRDPAGHIDQVVASNRERYSRDEVNLASRNARIPVSSVASNVRPAQSSNLRPGAQGDASGNPGELVASVKTGEGVAQVVYRVLGTRDPDVINWVIRENNIRKDRRGNPIIHPEQKLKLPQGGNTGQAASAARR